MALRRRWPIAIGVVGVIAIGGSFVWRSVAEPRLVRYPTDLKIAPAYAGTVTLYLDPQTKAPLATPKVFPLRVVRSITADGAASTYDKVVLKEDLSLTAEGFFAGKQANQYVMDRRTIVNVKDPLAFAYDPANVVDRSGAYRLAFPFHTKAEPTTIYKNETETTYTAKPLPTGRTVEGLATIDFAADVSATPISAAYAKTLDSITKLPAQLDLAGLQPFLAQVGVDVTKTLTALQGIITPDDLTTLVAQAGKPIPLQYVLTFSGEDSVEPDTGSIVEVRNVKETLGAKPNSPSLPIIVEVLAKYQQVPEAKAAVAGLTKLAAAPIPVFTNEFSQTPESVKEVANEIKDQRDKLTLAESTVPTGLLIGGIVLVLLAIALMFLPARRSGKGTPEAPDAPVVTPDGGAGASA
jgi:hypothetical protein